MGENARELAELAARTAAERKAEDVVVLDVRELTPVADYFVLASAVSLVHLGALREAVTERLKEAGWRARGTEGRPGARWILLDYGDVVVHLFHHAERDYYDLERLWGDARRFTVAVDGGGGTSGGSEPALAGPAPGSGERRVPASGSEGPGGTKGRQG